MMKLLIFLFLSLNFSTAFADSGFLSKEDQKAASPAGSSDLNLDKKFNVKLNILGSLFGLGDLSAEYKISPHLTLGGSFIYGTLTQESKNKTYEFDIKTIGGNLKANYYFSEAFTDGFYASLYGGVLKFDVELVKASFPAGAEFSSTYIGLNGGYNWFWQQFNFGLGAGYSHTFEDKEAEIQIGNISGTTTVKVHFNLIVEANIGWVF